jgi:hypothetical protein
MYHATGFDTDEIIDIRTPVACAGIPDERKSWPPCLGFYKSVVVTLAYKRHNRTQAEIGESFGVSQPTSAARLP